MGCLVGEVFLGCLSPSCKSTAPTPYADAVMNRGGGTRNLKTRDRGNLMSPCHTLSHPQVTCDKSRNMSH